MSDITGTGHGSAHNWKRGDTTPYKTTSYTCRSCGDAFIHAYDDIPNIFEAIKVAGVSEYCTVTREDEEKNDD